MMCGSTHNSPGGLICPFHKYKPFRPQLYVQNDVSLLIWIHFDAICSFDEFGISALVFFGRTFLCGGSLPSCGQGKHIWVVWSNCPLSCLMRGESPRVKKSSRSNAVDRQIITNVKYKLNQTGSNWHRNSVLDGNFERHLALFVKWTNRPLVGVAGWSAY